MVGEEGGAGILSVLVGRQHRLTSPGGAMILKIDDLVSRLDTSRNSREMADTSAAEALWIKFSDGKIHSTQDFRTPDGIQLLQLHLDANDQLLGLEIFP